MKKFKSLIAILLAVFTVTALGSCAVHEDATLEDNIYTRSAMVPDARTLSGGYLAGRHAQRNQDWDAAQNYMGTVVSLDSENDLMLQRAFLLAVGAQNHDQARALAQDILDRKLPSDIALVYLVCDAIAKGDYSSSMAYLDQLPDDGFGDFTKPVLKAWALMGQGNYEEAVKALGAAPENDPTYHFHAGLMAEMHGDVAATEKHYRVVMENGLSLHSAVHIAEYFERRKSPEITKKIYDGLGQLYPYNPFTAAADGDAVADPVTSAAQGASLALFDLATLLYERRAYDSAQIYGGMVLMLAPDSTFTNMMLGDIAAMHEHYPKAVSFYDKVGVTSPLYWLSRMRVAEVFEMNGDTDGAVRLLTTLAKNPTTKNQALISLGDIFRRKEDFTNAIRVYDEALAGIDTLTEEHWSLIYARGMSLERLNNWDRAEKDLLTALSLQPENPMILNYIGYSWADKGMHLDKALDYIRKAVALRPQDGYILDSYGWALYKTADYKEAVKWLERAVDEMPNDPTILDHLGDAYWQAGRHTESGFLWQQAKGMSRDPAFRAVLDEKIENGMPQLMPAKSKQKEAKL